MVTVWGFAAFFAVMLAAAVCAVLLIMATRHVMLRQIQANLLILCEQSDSLQRSLQSGQPDGGGNRLADCHQPAYASQTTTAANASRYQPKGISV
jgi:hypothetical protein